jgi:hypothetical protein
MVDRNRFSEAYDPEPDWDRPQRRREHVWNGDPQTAPDSDGGDEPFVPEEDPAVLALGDPVPGFDDEPEYETCECEQDWNCALHGGTSRPTWIETRYTDDDEEARYG